MRRKEMVGWLLLGTCLIAVRISTKTSTASAQEPPLFNKPKDFVQYCNTLNKENESFCVGYVSAIVESAPRQGSTGICVSNRNSGVVAAMAVTSLDFYIKTKQGIVIGTTPVLLQGILSEQFPCGGGTGK